MIQISVSQAQRQFSKLVDLAAAGEVIIIVKKGEPVAKLMAIDPDTEILLQNNHQSRVPGSMKGQIWMADNFDAPMSEEELAFWYDAPIFPSER